MTPVQPKRVKPILGLVGGIGAGKTCVARILESLGAALIDFDRLAHEELSGAEVVDTIRRWWGDIVCRPDGTADRKAIAAIVFERPAELDRLEKLLYPGLHRRRERLVAGYEAEPSVRAIVLDAPKLYEAGLGDSCDAVLFVDAERGERVRRVQASRGWSEKELERREKLQNSLDAKKANADYVVSNRTSMDALRVEVERVFASVLAGFS